MDDFRIESHPIIKVMLRKPIKFKFKGQELSAFEGETIASALYANGIRIFGHHYKDGAPLGIFCANGQCDQCKVIANGITVKACMTKVESGMEVWPLDGLPVLPDTSEKPEFSEIPEFEYKVLIIGGGPAGLRAATILGEKGVKTLIVDDKNQLGGKLVLQTHKFFGSVEACYAGMRGIDIAKKLEEEVRNFPSVDIWLNSVAIWVFSDKKVGILKDQSQYVFVKPEIILTTTGARERSIIFPGNTLPGVYGAGAFQTLVNRDLVKAAKKLFVIGGGNVGLIAAYHALQAGIDVVGLTEILPEVGGYLVHKEKLLKLGVPVFTSHTVLRVDGKEHVESITIAEVDENFKVKPGTEKTFECDTVLVAVGLDPVNEFYDKAREFGFKVFAAGDAEEIAEASSAIFSGKIKGLEILKTLGLYEGEIPKELYETQSVLKSRPGKAYSMVYPRIKQGVYPILNCVQEIPCNPCDTICPKGSIKIEGSILNPPKYLGGCIGCEMCVAICPGIAIALVDFRKDEPIVTIPFEFKEGVLKTGDIVDVTDRLGNIIGKGEVISFRYLEKVKNIPVKTRLVKIKVTSEIAERVAGIRIRELEKFHTSSTVNFTPDDAIVCRCERVTAGEIRKLIREGLRDMNEIKALTRAGMGACQGKTCTNLIKKIFREEGIPEREIKVWDKRPLFMEVTLGTLAGIKEKKHDN
jgi:NADPH-dependent 2,4-dienoyl-CoA reductase/sulfur reductase-like enzyme/Fe-S-cluster-containing hydrogenase component 2/bacterioferritin-associated ferredoxin